MFDTYTYINRYSRERPKFFSRYRAKKSKEKYRRNESISSAAAQNELLQQKEFLDTGDDDKRLLRTPSPQEKCERGISFIQIETDEKKVAQEVRKYSPILN